MKTRSVIRQSVVLPAPADRLFAMYLDPKRHGQITGAPVTISRRVGSAFEAFGGSLSGQMLAVEAPRLVVQSWRSTNFGKDDPDSTLVLEFSPVGRMKGRIMLLHFDVPEVDYKGVTEGWKLYYWVPWREYLRRRR